MKKGIKKKWLILGLVCTFAIAGCTSKQSTEVQPEASKNADGIYEPMLTITTAKGSEELAGKYDQGDNINNNPLTRWGEENLGIKIETIMVGGGSEYNTKLRLGLTGSEELPDVFPVYDSSLIADMIESKRVMDITEDFEKYASDRIKALYEQYPQAFYASKIDDKIYGLPLIAQPGNNEPVMWIRQDWLDSLALKAPETVEEFEKVLDAFTNQDPDGNQVKDTYGWTLTGRDGFSQWMSDSSFLFGAFSGTKGIPGQWNVDDDGTLIYGGTAEGTKDTLATLKDWYTKGYLNPELGVQSAWDAMDPFIQGKAGILFGPYWTYGSVKDVEKTIKGAEVQPYKLPVGKDGVTASNGSILYDGTMMFNSNFTNMEAFFEYYDKFLDYAYGTGDFEYGFFEGVDYDIVNDKPVYEQEQFDPPSGYIVNSDEIGKMSMFKNSPILPGSIGEIYSKLSSGEEPTTNLEKRVAYRAGSDFKNDPIIKAGGLKYEIRENAVQNQFTGAPTKTMKTSWSKLQTMETETFIKIVYGQLDIDAYDTFLQDWKSKGGEEITKEVNEWYQSVKK